MKTLYEQPASRKFHDYHIIIIGMILISVCVLVLVVLSLIWIYTPPPTSSKLVSLVLYTFILVLVLLGVYVFFQVSLLQLKGYNLFKITEGGIHLPEKDPKTRTEVVLPFDAVARTCLVRTKYPGEKQETPKFIMLVTKDDHLYYLNHHLGDLLDIAAIISKRVGRPYEQLNEGQARSLLLELMEKGRKK